MPRHSSLSALVRGHRFPSRCAPCGAAALVLVGAVAALGAQSPPPPSAAAGTDGHFAHTVTVAAAPSQVWAVWMDVARWPAWDTELREASAEAPLAANVRGRLVPLRGRPARFRVAALVPERSYTLDTALPLATLRITRTLEPTAEGTRFTHDVRFTGPLGWLFARQLGPAFRRALPDVMNRVAAQARADSSEQTARAAGAARP